MIYFHSSDRGSLVKQPDTFPEAFRIVYLGTRMRMRLDRNRKEGRWRREKGGRRKDRGERREDRGAKREKRREEGGGRRRGEEKGEGGGGRG